MRILVLILAIVIVAGILTSHEGFDTPNPLTVPAAPTTPNFPTASSHQCPALQITRTSEDLQALKQLADSGDPISYAQCYGTDLSPAAEAERRRARLRRVKQVAEQSLTTLKSHPTFQSVVKRVAETKLDTDRMRRDLARTRAALQTALSQVTINNIIRAKEELSNKQLYLQALSKMRNYGDNARMNITNHPEYQRLARKLNELTRSQVESEQSVYQQFMVQSKKCRAIFGKDVPIQGNEVGVYRSRVSKDPAFGALMYNIAEAEAQRNSTVREVLNSESGPEDREFLINSTADRLRSDPVYLKTVALMIKDLPKQ